MYSEDILSAVLCILILKRILYLFLVCLSKGCYLPPVGFLLAEHRQSGNVKLNCDNFGTAHLPQFDHAGFILRENYLLGKG